MTTEPRKFRLSLTIEEHPVIQGTHAILGVVHEPGNDVPLLAIEAGGVPANEEGAAILAQMLQDAATAIQEYVGAATVSTDTSELPAMEVPEPITRPRFNPQPRKAIK